MSIRKLLSVLFAFMLVTCFSRSVEHFLLDNSAKNKIADEDFTEVARKKKKDKYLLPILLTGLMLKIIILPLAYKSMAVMTSVAVLLSTMSLIVSSIIGFTKYAWSYTRPVKIAKINDIWPKDDSVNDDYSYYPENIDYIPSFPPFEQIHHY